MEAILAGKKRRSWLELTSRYPERKDGYLHRKCRKYQLKPEQRFFCEVYTPRVGAGDGLESKSRIDDSWRN